jgi:hypothetical protein
MDKINDLELRLKKLDEDYENLHSNLIKAEANHDESGIIKFLSMIHSVARQQSKIKEAQIGTNQNS